MFTLSDFRLNFPEFSLVADTTVNRAYTFASFTISQEPNPLVGQAKIDLMTEYLVAHILQLGLNTQASATGDAQPSYPIASATEGSVSLSLVAPPTGKDAMRFWLFLTQYGISLLSLARTLISGGYYAGGEFNDVGIRNR
jgi:Protein of unknown function (DUF4054)